MASLFMVFVASVLFFSFLSINKQLMIFKQRYTNNNSCMEYLLVILKCVC